MKDLPQSVTNHIGHTVVYTAEGNGRRKPKKVTGIVVDAKLVPGTRIVHMDNPKDPGRRAFKFKIKPTDGSRAIWTMAFPVDE